MNRKALKRRHSLSASLNLEEENVCILLCRLFCLFEQESSDSIRLRTCRCHRWLICPFHDTCIDADHSMVCLTTVEFDGNLRNKQTILFLFLYVVLLSFFASRHSNSVSTPTDSIRKKMFGGAGGNQPIMVLSKRNRGTDPSMKSYRMIL